MKIQKLSEKLITLLAVAVLVVVMNIIDVACVFKEIFGIFCPGCGMTRAYISLLYLDFRSAFLYHPMFWSIPLLILFYLFDGKLFRQKWLNTTLLVGILAGFIICWIVRMILYG
ncbi:MAG: DUF2752 domain-containing protein [Clostridia bacterium]|nr:DUF2752 domain-containing protein [Clostridia bacterium]